MFCRVVLALLEHFFFLPCWTFACLFLFLCLSGGGVSCLIFVCVSCGVLGVIALKRKRKNTKLSG